MKSAIKQHTFFVIWMMMMSEWVSIGHTHLKFVCLCRSNARIIKIWSNQPEAKRNDRKCRNEKEININEILNKFDDTWWVVSDGEWRSQRINLCKITILMNSSWQLKGNDTTVATTTFFVLWTTKNGSQQKKRQSLYIAAASPSNMVTNSPSHLLKWIKRA